MGDGHATAVLTVHRTGEASDFEAFARRIGGDAAAAEGFVGWQHSVANSDVLEQAIVVSFLDEPRLQRWLDRAGGLLADSGFLRIGLDLFIDGFPRTPGVLRVREMPGAGREAAFLDSAEQLARLKRSQPGYEGSSLFPPGGDDPNAWSSITRFRTDAHLDAWLSSPELAGALPSRHEHLTQESQVMTATSFGSTVRVSDGAPAVTPDWKMALLIQFVLYPLIMLFAKFVNPFLGTLFPQPWLATFVSVALTIVILTWVLMPLGHRLLHRWLDPVEGATPQANLRGLATVFAGFAVFMTIFGTVGFLQH